MRKFFQKLSLLTIPLLTPLGWGQTVTVTADLKSMFAGNQATKTQVCFSLVDAGGQQIANPRAIGTGVIVPTSQQCVSPDASGHISTTVYANDQISPAGSLYSIQYTFNGRTVHGDTFAFVLADGTENLNTKAPITTVPLVQPPTGDSTYARKDGGNQPFAGPIQAPAVNGVLAVIPATPGADWCAKVNAILLTVPTTGATVDTSALTGAQSCASNPYAGVSNPSVLKVGAATVTVSTATSWQLPAGSSLTGLGLLQSIIQFQPSTTLDAAILAGNNTDIGNIAVVGNSHVGRGIDAGGVSNVRIHDTKISGITGTPSTGPNAAIRSGVNTSTDVWIKDNILTGNGVTPVINGSADIQIDTNTSPGNLRFHIRNNQISGSNTNVSIAVFDCVDCDTIGNVIDENNKIRNDTNTSGGYGIMFYTAAFQTQNGIISDNKIRNTAGAGIYAQNCINCTIGHNVLINTAQQEQPGTLNVAAIALNAACQSSAVGNTIITGTQDGINSSVAPPVVGNTVCGATIEGNTIQGTSRGIVLNGTPISNQIVKGNQITGLTGSGGNGTGIITQAGNQLTNSQIIGNNTASLPNSGMFFNQLNDVQIIGNNIGALATNWNGIQVNNGGTGSSHVTISGNDITGGGGSSECIALVAADSLIQNNDSHGCATAGIDINSASSTDIRIDNNRIKSTATGIIDTNAVRTQITNNTCQSCTTPYSLGSTSYADGNHFTTGAMSGKATLVAGTVTVNTAEVQTGDKIFLTNVLAGGTLGNLSVGAIVNGTSFVINSSSATDTSTVAWRISH